MRFSAFGLPSALLALALTTNAAAGELMVSAAVSLAGAFKEVAAAYGEAHPETRVQFNFGASDALLRQIAQGAPADLFASADEQAMDSAQTQGLVLKGERRVFARNSLVLVVPADSKLGLKRLEDLRGAAVRRIAVGNPASVPAGRYARRALEAAGLWTALEARMVNAQSARQALDYVSRGEVDAGFVYATDARIVGEKLRVVIDIALDPPVSYPIAPVAGSAHLASARDFLAFLRSPRGEAILTRHGFLAP